MSYGGYNGGGGGYMAMPPAGGSGYGFPQWGPPNPFTTSFHASIQPGPNPFGNQTVVDKVPVEMLGLIDVHWYQFAPMNPLWHSLLGMAMAIFVLLSLTGNGVVISVFMSTKTLRTPANLLVVNLAFSDFCMMFTMGPPMIINCYYETWVFGPLMCEIYGMLGSLWGYVSIGSMVMIALDRYNVIVRGFASKPLTTKSAILKILFTWFIALIWTVIPLFGWNRYVPEGNMTACGLDYLNKDWFSRSYILVYAFFCYFIPLFTIIYAYYFIVKAVFGHEKQMREQAKKMNVASFRATSPDAQKQSTEAKLAKIALMTISLWFMAWTPYLIINFMGVFEGSKISPLATIWGSVFAKMGSIYNPVVYGISHPKYRAALLKKYPCLACAAEPPEAEILSQSSNITTAMIEDKA